MRDPAGCEQIEDARGATRIELGERIIEQDERSTTSATKRGGLEQTQRYRRCALLSRRPERAKGMPVERKLEVVTMRPNVREPSTDIDRSMPFE